MDENLLEENTGTESGIEEIDTDNGEILPDHVETGLLDDSYFGETSTTGDEVVDELSDGEESLDAESDTTTVVYTYSEEQQQVDNQIVEHLDRLNGTCTLLLFFLLFAWVDKKVRFFVKGMGYGQSN